jgi:hypothetical protein
MPFSRLFLDCCPFSLIYYFVCYFPRYLSMYKHIQGPTSFFPPARFKSCLFFKFLLIYSKPCLVQLPRPYSFQKISWPPLDYLLWRHKHDLKRAGGKKDVGPCICLYIDSIFTWIVTRPCAWASLASLVCITDIFT